MKDVDDPVPTNFPVESDSYTPLSFLRHLQSFDFDRRWCQCENRSGTDKIGKLMRTSQLRTHNLSFGTCLFDADGTKRVGKWVVVCRGGGTMRVLVVADRMRWPNQIRLLQRRRWEFVTEASDGLEAIRKAQELLPDLILLDAGLPNIDGVETARELRKRLPDSKILFLSDQFDGLVQETPNLGTSGYVVKARAARELLGSRDDDLQERKPPSSYPWS